jgi:hypothetical protein
MNGNGYPFLIVKPNRIKGKQTSGKSNCSSLPSTFFFHSIFEEEEEEKNDGRHVKDPPSTTPFIRHD